MYCTSCGEKIGEQAKFCPACGQKLENIDQRHKVTAFTEPVGDVSKSIDSDTETTVQETAEVTAIDPVPTAKSTHPWRRFLARNVDVFLGGLLIFVVLIFAMSIMFPSNVAIVLEAIENPIVAGLVIYVLWMPVEATFLAATGTTPAKWLFGISVGTPEGGRLSYGDAFKRTGLVFFQGEGGGIPFITLFTRIFAYRRLLSTGTTLWDTDVGAVVHHKQWGPGRAIACTLVVICALLIFGLLNSM